MTNRRLSVLLPFCLTVLASFSSCGGRSAFLNESQADALFGIPENLYASDDWTVRIDGISYVKSLHQMYQGDAVVRRRSKAFLLKAAQDEHSKIAIEAAKALAPYLADEDVSLCLQTLSLPGSDPNVRWAALTVLAARGDPQNADLFVSAFTDKDILIREAAVKGMLAISDEAVLHSLVPNIASALEDKAVGVQTAALDNLRFTDERLYPVLAKFFTRRISVSVLGSALGAINGYRLDTATREKIILLLTHSNSNIRLSALRALKSDEKLKAEKFNLN